MLLPSIKDIRLGSLPVEQMFLGSLRVWSRATNVVTMSRGLYGLDGFEMLPPFNAQRGAYVLNGRRVEFYRRLRVGLDSGAYALVGPVPRIARTTSLEVGQYKAVGKALLAENQKRLIAEAGAYAATWPDVRIAKSLFFDEGAYVLTGAPLSYKHGRGKAVANPATYTLQGKPLAFVRHMVAGMTPGHYTYTGLPTTDTEVQRNQGVDLSAFKTYTILGPTKHWVRVSTIHVYTILNGA